jgi:hypothetical protein
MAKYTSEFMLLGLALAAYLGYLVRPDETTKLITVMAVSGFLTITTKIVESALPELKAGIFGPKKQDEASTTTVTQTDKPAPKV